MAKKLRPPKKTAQIGFTAAVGRARVDSFVGMTEARFTRNTRTSLYPAIDKIHKLIDAVEVNTAVILYDALYPTFVISQEWCPKRTGDLVRSGFLTITNFRGQPRVVIGYAAGGKPAYAVIVHEKMEYIHKPPTMAKWLQRALEADSGNIQRRINDGMQELNTSGNYMPKHYNG